jgi:hypothetical protein
MKVKQHQFKNGSSAWRSGLGLLKPRQNNYVFRGICPDPTDVLVAPRSNE